ncbi:23S rRNA (uracil(1939)-C(5))-methyltransferase RlmD [Acidaminobacter sp. JC074]|uniref:23S rRNA (uracil(1939)-C(5))-methyltransferase RlmD n=1 Tax=Acidaminobacter sp. JC074 TaxID=2530199 RepID=UPI001F0D2CB3|nr:23S rRNA (uracil(1939)-C(5))-methyltransferase RlmD [Acidaminobacter sp. JC074]MCH4891110.1 23S rRNA (uracil(1939)-C(5))-methyltransferase RlmD [Acidaminobacter sp. JC074]
MKRGQLIELTIDDVRFPSKGVGTFNDKPIHVKNTLPGQVVQARVKKKRKEHVEAKLVKVLERSPMEVESFCEHFGKCGGCAIQTLSYDDQVKNKARMVEKLLSDNNINDYEYGGVIKSPLIYEYRNKMEFSFGDEEKNGPLQLGMHKKGRMHDVVNVPNCHICQKDFTIISDAILNFCVEHNMPKYNKRSHEGFLRHLTVRKGLKTGEILIGLSASTQFDMDYDAYVKMLLDLELDGEIVGILHILNDGMGDVVQGPIKVLYGREYYYEELFDLRFKVSFFSFFQTNTFGAEVLYNTAMDHMDDIESKVVFDLFSGTGTIGQIMSKKAKKVYGIELIEDAVVAAKENAALNKIENAEFIAGDVFDKLEEIKERPDYIVLDPPRMGILEKTLKKIIDYKVDGITYISCNPKTLAVNLQQLQKAGYKVERVTCVDMFCHTPHLETVVKLKLQ